MKNSIAFVGLIGLGAYLYFSKKNFAKSANFSFESLKLDLPHKKIFVTLGVSNPTNQTLNIKSIVGNLIMNNSTVAAIENFTNTTIKPNAKSLIKLQLVPSAMGIFEQAKIFIQNILKKKTATVKKTVTATFKGAANLEGLTVPIDINLLG